MPIPLDHRPAHPRRLLLAGRTLTLAAFTFFAAGFSAGATFAFYLLLSK